MGLVQLFWTKFSYTGLYVSLVDWTKTKVITAVTIKKTLNAVKDIVYEKDSTNRSNPRTPCNDSY